MTKPTNENTRHPIQPVIVDPHGIHRFKENKIVNFLLQFTREHGVDLNSLHCMPFSNDDWSQFNQLMGYSVSGFAELSYSPEDVVNQALDESARLVDPENEKTVSQEIDYKTKYYNLRQSIRLYAQQSEQKLTNLE